MRTQRYRSISPQMGSGAVQDRLARRRGLSSPRAWAFTLLGLDAYCAVVVGDLAASRMRELLADRLMSAFHATETKDWLWFEDVLAYDNARLPQALLAHRRSTQEATAGQGRPRVPALADGAADHAGWIFQTRRHRELRRRAKGPQAFDQQPVEAAAAISACLAAWRRGRRRGVDGRSNARVRLVSGRQRPADIADRSRYRRLPGWAASGSTQ